MGIGNSSDAALLFDRANLAGTSFGSPIVTYCNYRDLGREILARGLLLPMG
jgi:hypothetical protein